VEPREELVHPVDVLLDAVAVRPLEGDWLMPSLTISCGRRPTMSCPLKTILPRLGRLMPWMERSVVDLPAPFAPISVTISPSFTVIEMPLTASMVP
jgi:hypothetical protein